MTFDKNPSKILQNLYMEKYWQCQDPKKAKVIFLSLDANWDEKIEQLPIFPKIVEYLQDGVKFWEREGIHHPFLLPEYEKRDGYRFHKNFSKLNIGSENANYISFIELLNVPTFGISSKDKNKFSSLLDMKYLKEIQDIIFDNREKLVFVPKAVYDYLKMIKRNHNIFNNLLEPKSTVGQEFINIHNKGNVFIFICNHFSASNFNSFYENMGIIVKSFLSNTKKDTWWKVSYKGSYNDERVDEERFIEAANVIEVKKVLCRYMNPYRVEQELQQLNICPSNQEDIIKQEYVWE